MAALVLPPVVAAAVKPLFAALPLDLAMPGLVVAGGPAAERVKLVETVLGDPALKDRPDLAAGLWLYVDDLERSHRLSQQREDDATFNYWHAIMHRREGDFPNSGYWFRRTGLHPAMASVAPAVGRVAYEPFAFLKLAEEAHGRKEAPGELIELQRREWAALFGWCAARV